MGGSGSPRRTQIIVFGALILATLAATLLWTIQWASPVMSVTVTVSTDREGSVEVYQRRSRLSEFDGSGPVLASEIDLGRWEGELIRLDVRGEVRASGPLPVRKGFVGFSAELVGSNGTHPMEFLGWENSGPPELHLGTIGCSMLATPDGGDPSFAYGENGSLWRVLRVPEDAVLRISLAPVVGKAAGHTKPSPARARAERRGAQSTADGVREDLPNVFIYLIDAMRADHVSAYGYPRKTTPAMEVFASQATLYEQTQTAATWTRPSVSSLLTGLYPFVHGAMHRTTDRLGEWPVLLPEILKGVGYTTWAVVTNTAVNQKFGFDQGYHGFKYRYKESAEWVNARVAEYLAASDPDRPVFIYIHTMEPHSPYTPKPESLRLFDRGIEGRCDGSTKSLSKVGRVRPKVSDEDVEHLIDLYDAELFDADQGFAQFVELLRRAGRFEDAMIILVADHGEAFNEHRTLEHGNTLNQEEMHVPLIVRYPGGQFAGVRVSERVSLIDVLPTILGVVGIEADLGYVLPGRDLTPSAGASASPSGRRIYCEVSKHANNHLDLVGIIDEDGYKRVIDTSMPRGIRATKESIGVWDTNQDPTEKVNLWLMRPVRASYDEQLIVEWLIEQRRWREALAPGEMQPIEMTDELEREMRGLGYLD